MLYPENRGKNPNLIKQSFIFGFTFISITEANTNTESVLKEATMKIHSKYQFFETTLQIEEFQTDMADCNQCSNPEL